MEDGFRNELSDQKFVQWSSARNHKFWDVQAISQYVNRFNLKTALDIGGGIGSFARSICDSCSSIERFDVVDPSVAAHQHFIQHPKIRLIPQHFEEMHVDGEYDLVTINLVLHHLVAKNDRLTSEAQDKFLEKAVSRLRPNGLLMIEENFYEGLANSDITGRLIYEATRLKLPARLFRKLGANTAGEGVRFRSKRSWDSKFQKAGLQVIDTFRRPGWGRTMPFWQKVPLLCSGRYQELVVLKTKA